LLAPHGSHENFKAPSSNRAVYLAAAVGKLPSSVFSTTYAFLGKNRKIRE